MINYKKMSLFDNENTPNGSILVHGCNAQGVWGSGIAKEFKAKYPNSYTEYNEFCLNKLEVDDRYGAVGNSLITNKENNNYVGCLITSVNYGDKKDTPEQIIAQTYLALDSFFENYYDLGFKYTPIYSNKFNSGLFNVPWEQTAMALKYFTDKYKVDWTICDL